MSQTSMSTTGHDQRNSFPSSNTHDTDSKTYSNLSSLTDEPSQSGCDSMDQKSKYEESDVDEVETNIDVRPGEVIVLDHRWGTVTQPPHEDILVRSMHYLFDNVKTRSDSFVLPLAGVENWKTQTHGRVDHIAQHNSSWYSQHVNPRDDSVFILIINLQVTSIDATFVSYHVLHGGLPTQTSDETFNKMFDRFVNASDFWRDERLKLIPRVVDGPYLVRRAIQNRPVILGKRVQHRYFRGRNYLEIDSEVDGSVPSAALIKLAHGFSKKITVDMSWVIEGIDEDELPERLMAGVQIKGLDFEHTIELPHGSREMYEHSNEESYSSSNFQNNYNGSLNIFPCF